MPCMMFELALGKLFIFNMIFIVCGLSRIARNCGTRMMCSYQFLNSTKSEKQDLNCYDFSVFQLSEQFCSFENCLLVQFLLKKTMIFCMLCDKLIENVLISKKKLWVYVGHTDMFDTRYIGL